MSDKTSPIRAVSFDFGQTIAGLDAEMLRAKLAKRGVTAATQQLEEALPIAWDAYDRAVRAGVSGHPWKLFMRTLLQSARCEPAVELDGAVDFLWDDQPRSNLWRQPIAGMIDLCRELRDQGVPIGLLTNSEGKAAELLEECGWAGVFRVVIDSGKIGIEKPDPRIFEAFAAAIGVAKEEIVHVGDNFGADIQGALGAGLRAVWFRPPELASGSSVLRDLRGLRPGRPGLRPLRFGGRASEAPPGVFVCHGADELRAILAGLGIGASAQQTQ